MLRSPLQRLLPRGEHMQTPAQGGSPRFRVAKPLKGFAPLLFRECRRLSSCKRRMCPLGMGGTQPQRYFPMRGVYAPSYVGRNQPFFKADRNAPVGLCLQSRLHHALPFLRNAHVMRNTANLSGRPFYGRWLTAISPCHLFKSGLLPSMLLFRRWRKPLPKR